jgi:Raf kinase inhibitor-like YbhB/YbcL family protein
MNLVRRKNAMDLELKSTAFQQGSAIPREYTADGRNVPPPLRWTDPPAGTRSFALVCEDPDAPRGTFTHWALFNVPAEVRELTEESSQEAVLPNGAAQGRNDFGKLGYGGPSPPPGKPHRYFFKLYALDGLLGLEAGATKDQVLPALKGHVLAEGQLMGTHAR